jgi:hypothetical protein
MAKLWFGTPMYNGKINYYSKSRCAGVSQSILALRLTKTGGKEEISLFIIVEVKCYLHFGKDIRVGKSERRSTWTGSCNRTTYISLATVR